MGVDVDVQMSMCVYVMMCLTHTNQPPTVQSQAAVQRVVNNPITHASRRIAVAVHSPLCPSKQGAGAPGRELPSLVPAQKDKL